jgi:hypothetical protein
MEHRSHLLVRPFTLVDRLAEEHALKRGARRRVSFGR